MNPSLGQCHNLKKKKTINNFNDFEYLSRVTNVDGANCHHQLFILSLNNKNLPAIIQVP